jgi:hypothetical protein
LYVVPRTTVRATIRWRFRRAFASDWIRG